MAYISISPKGPASLKRCQVSRNRLKYMNRLAFSALTPKNEVSRRVKGENSGVEGVPSAKRSPPKRAVVKEVSGLAGSQPAVRQEPIAVELRVLFAVVGKPVSNGSDRSLRVSHSGRLGFYA
jgi:hypothetical protein